MDSWVRTFGCLVCLVAVLATCPAFGEERAPDVLVVAGANEFGGGLPDEILAVAAKCGLDYPRLARAAGKGDVAALRRLMRFSSDSGLDAASAEGHAAVLGELLRRVGDAKFAAALRQERKTVRQKVAEDVLYDTALSDRGLARWYPKTAAAALAPVNGSVRSRHGRDARGTDKW
jgi:histone H3/H4